MAIENLPILIFSGPSGAGKDTTAKYIKDLKLAPIEKVITSTTRAPRHNNGVLEQDGVDYDFYPDSKMFLRRVREGYFIEHAQYGKNYYGTPWERVQDILDKGHIPMCIVEVEGAANIARELQKKYQTLSIFIRLRSPEEHEQRLRGRGGMSEEVIQERLATAKEELKSQENYDVRLINDESPETAVIISRIASDLLIGRTKEQICKIYDVFGSQLV